MYINTFQYKPEHIDCKLCDKYAAGKGCTADSCPWLAERIEAGVVGYEEAILEQMRYRGVNQPTGSVKMLEWVLAENILHCILYRKILLADHTIGQLLYVLPNDVEHPILAVKGEVYQEIAPWRLVWIIVEPDAVNGNRGEKH